MKKVNFFYIILLALVTSLHCQTDKYSISSDCQNGCKSCNFWRDTCYTCEDGWVLSGKVCKSCKLDGCKACTEDHLDKCLTCSEGYEPKTSDGMGMWVTCTTCPSNCKTCQSATKCTDCERLYSLKEDDGSCELSRVLWVLFIFLVVLIVSCIVILLLLYVAVTPIIDGSVIAAACGCIGELIGSIPLQ